MVTTRPLGRAGARVSAIGFGAWGLGGDRWRGVAPDEARRALAAAIAGGVTLVDTALVYGEGQSERLVGQVIRELGAADRVVIATKIPPADRRWPPAPGSRIDQVFPVDHVVRSVEASLANLGLDAIGLEQLHVWRDEWLDQPGYPALIEALEGLVAAGKIRALGVSVNDHAPATALRVVEQPWLTSVQVIYNVFDPTAAAGLMPRARARGVGVIARCALDEGALTGAITAAAARGFEPGEFRARYFAGGRAAEVEARVALLRPLLGPEASSLTELALRFALSEPAVSSVVVGMRRPRHVATNLALADGRSLSPDLLARLSEHAWPRDWYAET